MHVLNSSTRTGRAVPPRTNDGRKRMHVHQEVVAAVALKVEADGSGNSKKGSTHRERSSSARSRAKSRLWNCMESMLIMVATMMMSMALSSTKSVVVRSWGLQSTTVTAASRPRTVASIFASSSSSSSGVRLWDQQSSTQQDLESRHRSLSLISFDLDDTLFSTSHVVQSANEVMFDAMISCGCSSEVCNPDVFRETTRQVRQSFDESGAPTTYRDLRKGAIRQSFLQSSRGYTTEVDESSAPSFDVMVEQCYAAWLAERHSSAERFLFDHAIETLEELRRLYPTTKIAAITNGAGDPLEMPMLEPYFDFRISGEDDDVFPHRKPHSLIYETALRNAGVTPTDVTDNGVSNVGLWIHVGDCLSNDVGASADLGAKSIWMCLEDDEESAAGRLVDATRTPTYSSASQEELDRRAKKIEEGRSKVTASIRCLSELPCVISGILERSEEEAAVSSKER
mmetsp:Transcript_10727/g.25563  ORF Transcript_10727/g.25563 Transcript_10727/m.25563 type:complete len:455 (+) Transcript_10727:448-1812(+)